MAEVIVTPVIAQSGIAIHEPDVQGYKLNTITPAKGKKATATSNCHKEGEKEVFMKPHVEEIIATEETPDPNEILIVEEGDDPEGSWQAAKESDVKSTVAEIILHPTGSLDRQGEKSVETNT